LCVSKHLGRIYAAPERQQREDGSFVFPWFWATAVAKASPELGYEHLSLAAALNYSAVLWEILQCRLLRTDF